MKQKLAEAYAYYKKQYPRSLLLFRVNDDYVTHSSDLTIVSDILGVKSFPEYDLVQAISRLGNSGNMVKIIEYRNRSGEYDIPNIKQIEEDRAADY